MAQLIQARHFTPGRIRPIRLIVWHDMEAPEATTTAENIARMFASANSPQASTHLNGDPDSVVQSVLYGDTAWCAPGMNADGIHLEQAGYAKQTKAQWLDDTSQATMRNLAREVAPIAVRLGIPPVFLTDGQLLAGKAGMSVHVQGTRVYNGGVGHWDCGPNFPYDVVEAICDAAWRKAAGGTVTSSGHKYLTEDGLLDRGTWKVIQALVGAKRDGDPGPETFGKLQTWARRPVTGRWDSDGSSRDTDALMLRVGVPASSPLIGQKWSWNRAGKSSPHTLAIEQYINRGLRAGTFGL